MAMGCECEFLPIFLPNSSILGQEMERVAPKEGRGNINIRALCYNIRIYIQVERSRL